ncbi:MAG: four helix bundle protein, partial [Actinomycetota bacterium]|nr:four helix bundle protein [Actinomycetota bacterium]
LLLLSYWSNQYQIVRYYQEKFKKEFKNRVYRFTLMLVEFVDNLPRSTSMQIIGGQLLRSGTSIGANYIEAQSASSKKDFTNFFHHSLKSANESEFWLRILKDSGKASRKEVDMLLEELAVIANILGSSLLTLKGKK